MYWLEQADEQFLKLHLQRQIDYYYHKTGDWK